ncbi:class I SAM-dependent methyltransferase [Rhodanobacter ginsenosidimutans]|uniref:Class I SAM-dependent methyltransferase n=1 Tax=Rhodanobacter ginsenosidimutans TaxID=490571 RepID=A0ABW0JW92_9GAMM
MSRLKLRDQSSHFAFGENWLDFVKKIDDARISQAILDLQRLAGMPRLDGMSFLDIGCGSGLHALAAIKIGASRVVGVDIDADSVEASRQTLAQFAPDADTRFQVCSAFDMTQGAFGKFDIVYSWGVLHHTGDMDRAIECAANFVSPGGVLLLALYRWTPFCGVWRQIKRWYSSAPPSAQRRARNIYIAFRRFSAAAGGHDFDAYIRDYSKRRGMDFYNDVHDWLGGYPYESISASRCHKMLRKMGFNLDHEIIAHVGTYLSGLMGSACNEYAFHRIDD